jgi:hypothetical protein
MSASLALAQSVLYVARSATRIVPYDLDGRRLNEGFALPRLQPDRPARIAALAVDNDHRVWVADAGSRAVRAFSVFGAELSTWRDENAEADRRGALGEPTGIAVQGVEADLSVYVASRGERRYGLQAFDRAGELRGVLRARGEASETFHDLERVAVSGPFVYALERASGWIQVFRGGDFHFMFRAPEVRGTHPEPRAIAPLGDGRAVLATGGEGTGALLLIDGGGGVSARLAEHGMEPGQVIEPTDVVVEQGVSDRYARIAVIDQDGERIQVFSLAGACYGSFSDFPGATFST